MFERGIELLDYVPNYAYYAKIKTSLIIEDVSNIRMIYELNSFDRLRSDLSSDKYPSHAFSENQLKLQIQTVSEMDLGKLVLEIENNNGQVSSIDEYTHVLTCELPVNALKSISELSFVQFIMPIDAPGEPENYKGFNDHRVGALTRMNTGLSKDLDGSGMNVMLQDDGVIGPHIDYTGRIGGQFLTTNRGDHGDHTGGTIMGAGNLEPRFKGMAPASQLWVYGAAPSYPGFDSIYSHYNKYDIRITSTSYSNGVNAGYTALAKKLDDQIEKMDDLVHVFSAGNSRGGSSNGWYTITGGHKVAKNVITVANLDYRDNDAASSSQGPTKDGRIKPDIGAVGSNVMSTTNPNDYVSKSGTSMSCPGVAGTVTVLYQAYKELNAGSTPNFALMKAIVCNTADDIGNEGPDFTNGFGRINALKAYGAIKNKTYFKGSVSTGGSNKHSFSVSSTDRLLKVMLVWVDPQGTVGASRPLINDIDLEVSTGFLSPSKPLILDPQNPSSNAIEGRDSINNIEQVVITNPASGSYDITVKGNLVPNGPQEYYVVYILENDEITVEYPVGGESLVPIEKEMIRWSDAGNSGPYQLEYSIDNGANWSSIANVSANLRYYEWTVPNMPSSKVLVRVIGSSNTGVSPAAFSIFKVPNTPFLDYACPDSVGLKWNALDSAKHYVIYKLGAKYMDSLGTSTTNEFNLKESCIAFKEGWYAVSAIGNKGEIGRRSRAFYKDDQLFKCTMTNDIELVEFDPKFDRLRSCSSSDKINVGVKVKNNGNSPSAPFTLNMTLNNGAVIKENIVIAIAAGTSSTFNFTQAVTLKIGNNSIKTWVTTSKDQNSCNDTISTSFEYVDEQATSTSLTTNFDNFSRCFTTSNCGVENCVLMEKWYNSKNGTTDDIDWRVNNLQTPSRNTGPVTDHTIQSNVGNYLYLEASGGCTEQEAHLVSPCFDLRYAKNASLSFWYHMYGNTMGSLSLDVFVDGKWNLDVIPALSGNKGNQWLRDSLKLNSYYGKVIQFRFRGRTGSDAFSDLSIDDINFNIETNVSVEPVNDMLGQQVKVYPQPAQNLLKIESEIVLSSVRILDLTGKQVLIENVNSKNIESNLERLENGVYILELRAGNGISRKKIEIIR